MDVIIHTPVKALLAKALEALPEKLQLVYVDYRDQLTDDQVANLLAGDMEALGESMWDWESDNRYEAIKYQLGEILDAEDAERLMDDDEAWETFREACEERDESNTLKDLMSNTPGVMVRYYLDHDVEPYPYLEGEEEIEDRMHGIANAAGIDFETNRKALSSLVVEASYGGSLCVLHQSDLEDVLKVTNGGSVVFTDPYLLVYDGLNGSGMDAEVTGTVTWTRSDDTPMRHDSGSYSWSDDIAGVVHSAYNTTADFKPKED